MKLIILDRDGTINHDSDAYIKSPAEWRPLDGSLEAIARLTQADYKIAVATNQSGIARGLFDTTTLIAIHDMLQKALGQVGGRIDAFFFCPHAADSACMCRKPQPGMLLEAARRFNVAPKETYMVGDALRDLEAAAAVGAKPYLVLTGKGYGVTNLVALDRTGAVVSEFLIQVEMSSDTVVVVYRGAARESYSCTPDCMPRVSLGDTQQYFDSTMGQTVLRTGRSQAAGTSTGAR